MTQLRYVDAEEVGMAAQRVRHVRDLARGWVAEGLTPALVVLAARRGAISIHEAFGRSGPEPDSPPLALDTVFPLASISKPITATLAMILVDEGLLGLNRPVQEYVPEFVGEGKDQVMVHHLLTHTSGLTNAEVETHLRQKDTPGPWTLDEGRFPTRESWVSGLFDAPLSGKPGLEMSYCGAGYEIVGEIIQRVSGQSLEAVARQRLFDPLGMGSTWYVLPESADHRVVRRSPDAPGAIAEAEWYRRGSFASGGVFSTALDLAVFGQMIVGGGTFGNRRILSRASVSEMTRNQIPGIGASYLGELFPEASWGFGWNVEAGKKSLRRASLFSERAISHGGFGGSYIWVDPTYELVGVYLSVCPKYYPSGMEKWNADLFANAVTAAVLDV